MTHVMRGRGILGVVLNLLFQKSNTQGGTLSALSSAWKAHPKPSEIQAGHLISHANAIARLL